MRISIGVVIAIALIFYWYNADHPGVLWGAKPAAVQAAPTN